MLTWLKSLFPRAPREPQLDSELRFHVDRLTEEYMAAGLSPADARRKALLDFGGHEQTKEQLRDVHRLPVVEAAAANGKAAFRFLRKSPSFSLAVILTLALGIGANSAVFSAIDAILLRPLPFPEADQLMRVTQQHGPAGNPATAVAPVRLEDWSRLTSMFQALNGYYTEDVSETTGLLPEKVTRAWVYPHFFEVWQVPPALGREFNSAEETVNGPNAVVISDRFWRRRFAADPGVLGKALRLDGALFPVVGVMPPSFLFPNRDVDLWMPIPPGLPVAQSRKLTWFTVIGRVKPAVTLAQARADLAGVQAQLGRQFPETDADIGVGVQPLKDTTIGESRRSLWLLFASVSLLLLIACTNIATLLLSRSAQRQQEISIRFSLGAPRGQLVAQLLTETFVLALAGSAVGLCLAAGSARVFRSLAADLPRVDEIRLDSRIVVYTLACSLLVTLLCGLVPAVTGTRRSLSGLAQNSRSQISGRSPLQWTLVAVQVSLAVALLAGAGLLFRSLQQIGRVKPGFDPGHVLSFQLSMNYGETGDMKKLQQVTSRILDTLRAVPGAEEAAISVGVPGNPFRYESELKLSEGRAASETRMAAENRFVSPTYFATLRIPMLAGEPCRASLDPASPSAVVNRSFADGYLNGSAALGHHLLAENLGFKGAAAIVGIAGDAREAGLDRAPVPTVYWCTPVAEPGTYFLIRTRNSPLALAASIRSKIQQIEPARAVFDMAPLDRHFSDALAENRLRTVLLSFFAATAIALACVGLYGTLSYSVELRRREVGLRLALGAGRGSILRYFLERALAVCAIGCVAGSLLAAVASRLIASMLYGVSPSDAATFSSVFAGVLLVAAFASLAPALRASRTDPMHVLRDE